MSDAAAALGLARDATPDRARLAAISGAEPFVSIEGLVGGYGRAEILHGVDLTLGRGQSLCLIGPNGAGKSTILHCLFGFAQVFEGSKALHGTLWHDRFGQAVSGS